METNIKLPNWIESYKNFKRNKQFNNTNINLIDLTHFLMNIDLLKTQSSLVYHYIFNKQPTDRNDAINYLDDIIQTINEIKEQLERSNLY